MLEGVSCHNKMTVKEGRIIIQYTYNLPRAKNIGCGQAEQTAKSDQDRYFSQFP